MAKAVIVTTGTALRGEIIIGDPMIRPDLIIVSSILADNQTARIRN